MFYKFLDIFSLIKQIVWYNCSFKMLYNVIAHLKKTHIKDINFECCHATEMEINKI